MQIRVLAVPSSKTSEVVGWEDDPRAGRVLRVKIAAPVQPVPPEALEGVPVRPVILEGLTVTPYLKDVGNGRQRIAYSLRATGMVSPNATTDETYTTLEVRASSAAARTVRVPPTLASYMAGRCDAVMPTS